MTGTVEQSSDTEPLDLETMRETAGRLLDPDAAPDTLAPALAPAAEELETLTLQLRGHLDLLMPEVERKAARLPKDSIPRYCALACLGEARERLRSAPGEGEYGAAVYGRRLARVLSALVDHFETLSKVTR